MKKNLNHTNIVKKNVKQQKDMKVLTLKIKVFIKEIKISRRKNKKKNGRLETFLQKIKTEAKKDG